MRGGSWPVSARCLPVGNRGVQVDASNVIQAWEHPPKSGFQDSVNPAEPEDDAPVTIGNDPNTSRDLDRNRDDEE